MKFIDLFAGIGGFRIALESIGGKCVFSSEIDKECCITYNNNFGEYPCGDITKIDPKSIPNHDILCAGFPCQPFSISGKQKGFQETRGTLFFNILEIVKEKNPKVVFLENVKNLKNHDKGNTISVIKRCLEELGYKVNFNILNAKDFGLAQNRERLILIASNTIFDFSRIHKTESKTMRDIAEVNVDFEYLLPEEYTILEKKQWKKQKSGLIFCGYRNKKMRVEDSGCFSRSHKQQNRIYSIDGTFITISSQEVSGRYWIYDGEKVRKITLNECFKLQGFPDDFVKSNRKTISYRQIGNSVPIPMIKEVGLEIMRQLL